MDDTHEAIVAAATDLIAEVGPSKLGVLQEIVLVRNRDNHPESIETDSSHYSESDLKGNPP